MISSERQLLLGRLAVCAGSVIVCTGNVTGSVCRECDWPAVCMGSVTGCVFREYDCQCVQGVWPSVCTRSVTGSVCRECDWQCVQAVWSSVCAGSGTGSVCMECDLLLDVGLLWWPHLLSTLAQATSSFLSRSSAGPPLSTALLSVSQQGDHLPSSISNEVPTWLNKTPALSPWFLESLQIFALQSLERKEGASRIFFVFDGVPVQHPLCSPPFPHKGEASFTIPLINSLFLFSISGGWFSLRSVGIYATWIKGEQLEVARFLQFLLSL